MHHARLFMHALRDKSLASDASQFMARRAAILKILRDSAVGRQEELVRLLKRQGFEATQSSVSRDLRELGVAKAGDRYIVPERRQDSSLTNPFVAVANFVLEIRTAGPSITVVKTATGTAQSVAVAVDKARWPEVAGTISGDDTIFIATEDGRAQRKLAERLREHFSI
jgi:transcriptional regulator of arginine metabolism